MHTVLVIAAAESTRDAWCIEVRQRGMRCRGASAIVTARVELEDPTLAGIVFQSRNDDDLAELIALSCWHRLPPVVIVSGPTMMTISTRFTAGTIVSPEMSSAAVVARLAGMVHGRPLSSPTHLPVRLSRVADAQWTVQLTAVAFEAPPDDDSFDGSTSPDGFEIACA